MIGPPPPTDPASWKTVSSKADGSAADGSKFKLSWVQKGASRFTVSKPTLACANADDAEAYAITQELRRSGMIKDRLSNPAGTSCRHVLPGHEIELSSRRDAQISYVYVNEYGPIFMLHEDLVPAN
jgi:hypothetical protein